MLIRRIAPLTIGAWAAVILAMVFIGLLWLHGNRLVFSNDEGIILDAAARMLHGETLYRDCFGYMSPGSYWLQEAAFRLFGLSLWAGRVLVIFDFALYCALLFWLIARLAGMKSACSVTFLFFAFLATRPDYLLAQHRMDSGALSLASIALCLEGQRRRQSWWWLAAGALIVGAAVCTPSIALLAVVTVGWLVASPPIRRFLIPYGCGLCISSIAITAVLAATGSLWPLIQQMAWLQRNYAEVNVMPYGSIIGGYGAALGATAGIDRVVRALALFCLALPAVLPVAALAAWSLSMLLCEAERRWAANNAIPLLLAYMVMYIGSTFPRADAAHLAFVAVLPTTLTTVWIARYTPRWLAASAFGFLAIWAGMSMTQTARNLRDEVAVATPVGTLRAAASDAQAVRALLRTTRPQDAVYVHPYMPLLYFLTQGRNPTRYSYLAPGMMTRHEEIETLASLEKSPPRWFLYLPLSRAEFLRVFPHASGLNHQFPMIEAWRMRDYVPVEPPVTVGGYQLYEHRAYRGNELFVEARPEL